MGFDLGDIWDAGGDLYSSALGGLNDVFTSPLGAALNPMYFGQAMLGNMAFNSMSGDSGGSPEVPAGYGPVSIMYPEQDYYKQTHDTLQAQVDMAPEIFRANAVYQPLYAGLNYGIYDAFAPMYAQTGRDVAPIQADTAAFLNRAQRTSDIADVTKLGPQAVAAIRAANPDQAALLDTLTQQAMGELALNGKLGADEQRMIEQQSRAGFDTRGMQRSNPAVFSEVLNLEGARRQRRNEDRQFAGNVLGYQKSIYGDPFQAVLGRSNSNLAFAQAGGGAQNMGVAPQANPYSIFNPESQYASSLYNNNANNDMQASVAGANLTSDYYNTIYNANAAQQIAAGNNEAAMMSSLLSLGGNMLPLAFL